MLTTFINDLNAPSQNRKNKNKDSLCSTERYTNGTHEQLKAISTKNYKYRDFIISPIRIKKRKKKSMIVDEVGDGELEKENANCKLCTCNMR
jgi:hypothetical protein